MDRLTEELHESSDNKQRDIDRLTEQVSAISSGTFVGFWASPIDNDYYAHKERIIFDNVLLDSSNSYNTTDSAFTCPYSGYYQFFVTICNLSEEQIWKRIDAQLFIGDISDIKAVTSESTEGLNQSTIQYLTYCKQNEKVFVSAQFGDGYEGESRGIYGPYHSSFSGFLISLDN